MKLIGLVDTIKKAFWLSFDSKNLGFLYKCYAVSIIVSSIIYLPALILLTVSSAVNTFQELRTPSAVATSALSVFSFFPILIILLMAIFSVISATFIKTVNLNSYLKVYNVTDIRIVNVIKQSLHKIPSMILLYLISVPLVFLGYLFFIIPGIVLSAMFMFAPYILIEESCSPIEALKRSKALISGYKINIFIKQLSIFCLVLVFLIPFVVVLLLTQYTIIAFLPIAMFTMGLVPVIWYKELKNIKTTASVATVVSPAVS